MSCKGQWSSRFGAKAKTSMDCKCLSHSIPCRVWIVEPIVGRRSMMISVSSFLAAVISREMHSSTTVLSVASYASLACHTCCSRKFTLSSFSFAPADRVMLNSVALAEQGTYFVSCSIHCKIDSLVYLLQQVIMIF